MPVAAKHVCAVSLAALAFGASACGSAAKDAPIASTAAVRAGGSAQAPSQALPPGQTVRSDGDADNPKDLDGNPDPDGADDPDDDSYTAQSYRYPDGDDRPTLAYGRSPTPAERREIANVVTRYYTAAAAADGSSACALLLPTIARSVPEDYGSGAGPAYLRGGKTCAAVMGALFRHDRGELALVPQLLSVRMGNVVAQVVVGSRSMRANLVGVKRRGRSWYLQSLVGSPLP